MARLIIVRHGNTFDKGDTVTRVGGRTDLPLSASGLAQADALAHHFADTRFVAAFCSPLMRTRQTARAMIGMRTGSPALIVLPFLTEVEYGPDENQPEEKVVARIGEAALEAWERDATPPEGWLVDADALREGWRSLLERAAGLGAEDTALIVTSNGIARFLPDVVDVQPDDLDRKLKTGAWGVVEVDGATSCITSWNLRP
ncbi:histidine phosphatase family protein [Hyphomonas sp. KY3]|uniref:histidine phosphatase family protein n=1 Tax=Hyphomonas sp. KY3 TaxID=2016196 RepID=UPI001A8E9726|nr:histidine phosphatase family protein [Hyphomonas sp. KY3]QSR21401.1 histidine phosphatase family protein [Hyphomonas sp. KY3]